MDVLVSRHNTRARPASPRAFGRRWLTVALLASGLVSQGAAQQAPPEQVAWEDLQRAVKGPASHPAEPPSRYEQLRQSAAERIELAVRYLSHYPGGAHRGAVVRIQLEALFEHACLQDGDTSRLEQACRGYLADAPASDEAAEAAYWLIVCEQQRRRLASSAPASQPGSLLSSELCTAYRRYVDEYPASRHAPTLLDALFSDAIQRSDRDAMVGLVARAQRDFAGTPISERLSARLRRIDAVGLPFEWEVRSVAGESLSSRQFAGRTTLLIVWASFDSPSRRCLTEALALRREAPGLAVIGIALDTAPAHAVGCLGGDSPDGLACDGLGWAGEFARRWAVDELPTVLLIGPDGRLRQVAGAGGWPRLLSSIRSN